MNIQNLIDAYKKMFANVEWHIKTNEPKGSDLQICEKDLSRFSDIIQELESLDEYKAPPTLSKGGKEDVKTWLLNYCEGNFPGDFTVNEVVEIIIAYSPVPSLGVSAEEMKKVLNKYWGQVDQQAKYSFYDAAIDAMEQYASSLLKEKEDEIRKLKRTIEIYSFDEHPDLIRDELVKQLNIKCDEAQEDQNKIIQLQSSLDKANEEIKKYVGIAEALMGAAKKIEKLEALAEAADAAIYAIDGISESNLNEKIRIYNELKLKP